MTKEMLNEMKDFELFVEKMEKFVGDIKADEVLKNAGMEIKYMDLRTFDGEIFSLPNDLEDYFDMWQEIKGYYKKFKNDENAMDEFFFDLYWNDVEANSAYFQDYAFWVGFDQQGILCKY